LGIYLAIFSKIFIKINVAIIVFLKKVIIGILKILIYPLKLVIKILKKIFLKPISFIFINIRKNITNLFKKIYKIHIKLPKKVNKKKELG